MTAAESNGQKEKPIQIMEGVQSGGRVVQESYVPADQTMKQVLAIRDVEQIIRGTEGGLNTVAAELADLKSKLVLYDPNATTEIGRVAEAEAAARRGDNAGMVAALRGVARWVLDFATKVGTTVVSKIIENLLGMGATS